MLAMKSKTDDHALRAEKIEQQKNCIKPSSKIRFKLIDLGRVDSNPSIPGG